MTLKYWVSCERVKRRWWFGYRLQYWVENEFMRYGPFSSRDEALRILSLAGDA